MPLDGSQPIDLGLSNSNLGKTMAGSIVSQVPAALAESKQASEKQKSDIAATETRLDEDTKQRQALTPPKPPAAPPPPEQEHTNSANAWGSLAMGLAMWGGALTRQPLTNSLNAAASVLNAANKGDADAYKRAFDHWKVLTDYAQQMYAYQRDTYKDALDSIGTDQKEALAKLKVQAAANGDDNLNRLATAGNVEGILATEKERNARLAQLEVTTNDMKAQGQITHELLDAGNALRKNPNDPDAQKRYADAQQAAKDYHTAQDKGIHVQTAAQGREGAMQAAVDADVEDYKGKNPDATPADIDKARYDSRLKHEKEMGAATKQPRSAPAIALNTFIDETIQKTGQPPTAEQIQTFLASGSEKTAEGRTVGTRASAVELASNTADAIIPLLRASSEKINRTEYPTVNSVMIAAEKHTGDPEVVKYGELINSLRYAYGRAISGSMTPRVDDVRRADEILDAAWSKGQINAALDQMQQTIAAEKGAIRKTRDEVRTGGVGSGGAAQTPSAAAAPAGLPADLPPPDGHPDGTKAKDDSGKVIAVIKGGKWAAP